MSTLIAIASAVFAVSNLIVNLKIRAELSSVREFIITGRLEDGEKIRSWVDSRFVSKDSIEAFRAQRVC